MSTFKYKKTIRVLMLSMVFFLIVMSINNLTIFGLRKNAGFTYDDLLLTSSNSTNNIFTINKSNLEETLRSKTPLNTDPILNEINQAKKDSQIDESTCHTLLHILGEYDYEINKTVTSAILKNLDYFSSPQCSSGFMHGALIAYSRNINRESVLINILKEQMNKEEKSFIPDPRNFESSIEISRVHGIGHAIQTFTNDVEKSGQICKDISTNKYFLEMCLTGVFMQESAELASFDIYEYPDKCNKVSEEYKFSCFSGMVKVFSSKEKIRGEINNFTNTCNMQEKFENKISCIQNMSNQLTSSHFATVEDLNYACSQFDRKEKQYCLARASYQAKRIKYKNGQLCLANTNIYDYYICNQIYQNIYRNKDYMYTNSGELRYRSLLYYSRILNK